MENKTLKEQFLELSEKIMLGSEAGEFIDIVDVRIATYRQKYEPPKGEK